MESGDEVARSTHVGASTLASGTLSKSVSALAIEPLTLALTVTGRKAYDVMLWLAHRSAPSADGGYTSRVSTILRGYGSSTKASDRVQRYIEQMVKTTVVWRLLAPTDQATLPLEGFEGGVGEVRRDEARTFPLLAEARLFMRGGEAWVTWYYPPSIKEQLISPDRWAQIELQSITRLSTYTAVALYEICARYKDSPAGLTTRHEPEFWTRVLREGGGIKPREFRKFKNELLMPAIAEVNRETEISVELLEHRSHGVLESVQFAVSRPSKAKRPVPEPVDVTLVMRAAKLGIRELDLDALLVKYDAEKITGAFDAMESYVSDPTASRIHNRAAYLRAVLADRHPDGLPVVSRPVAAKANTTPLNADEEHKILRDAWRASRRKQIRLEFGALEDDERARWIDRATPVILQRTVVTPAMRKRLAERNWESPLIGQLILDAYASTKYGSNWCEPSEMDLVMHSAAEDR